MVTSAKVHSDNELPQHLSSGDHMNRKDFHSIYDKMPETFKAELIGGIVFVASPLKQAHGSAHVDLASIFAAYRARTPGVQVCDNSTVFLSDEDEVQPDLLMRILPHYGGSTKDTDDGYIQGAPELIAEIALSSLAIDLHRKRERYRIAGVIEYVVVCLEPKQIRCFNLSHEQELNADANGVYRSSIFPGLWLPATVENLEDYQSAMSILHEGLASGDHSNFVAMLSSRT